MAIYSACATYPGVVIAPLGVDARSKQMRQVAAPTWYSANAGGRGRGPEDDCWSSSGEGTSCRKMTADGMHMQQSCMNIVCASFIGGALEMLAERLL